jgi:hypothetical protein
MKFLDQVKIYVKAGNEDMGLLAFVERNLLNTVDLMVVTEVKVEPYS